MSEFPHHDWKLWKFTSTSRNKRYWQELSRRYVSGKDAEAEAEVRDMLDDLAQRHHLKSLEDWNRLSLHRVGDRMYRNFKYLGGLKKVLEKIYPHHSWAHSAIFEAKGAEQRAIKNVMQGFFPQERLKE